jgi:hypothetical protein
VEKAEMPLPFLFQDFNLPAINQNSRMLPKSARCTVDILSQILYYKTKDVGKIYAVLKVKIISCIVN